MVCRLPLDEWLARLETLHSQSIDLGLERCGLVYQRLCESKSIKPGFVVTIAGTNGKGTTLKMLENAAKQAGLFVGSYTSPHIFRFNERVRLNGADVSDQQLIDAFELVEQHRQSVPLTYYEFTTLAAFVVMTRQNLHLWLLEVGLGGRLDAVNLIDADLAVVTSIGLDHQAYLGDTRELIAREKLGICRPGRPVFFGGDDVPPGVEAYCQSQSVKLYDFSTRQISESRDWSIEFQGPDGLVTYQNLPTPRIPLMNAALAVQVWAFIADKLKLVRSVEMNSLMSTSLFGRMTCVNKVPEIWLDAAHNPAAAELLAQNLTTMPEKQTIAIVAMMADKDVAGTLAPLLPLVRQWLSLTLDCDRAMSAQVMAEQLIQLGADGVEPILPGEINAWLEDPAYARHRFLVFGSFYTLEAFSRHLALRS